MKNALAFYLTLLMVACQPSTKNSDIEEVTEEVIDSAKNDIINNTAKNGDELPKPGSLQNGISEEISSNTWFVLLKTSNDTVPKFIVPPCGEGPSLKFYDDIIQSSCGHDGIRYQIIATSKDGNSISYQYSNKSPRSMSLEEFDFPPFKSFLVRADSAVHDFLHCLPDSITSANATDFIIIKREDKWSETLKQKNLYLELPCTDMD